MQFIRSLIAAGALIVSAAALAPAQQPSAPPAPVGRRAVTAAKHARARRRQHVHKALMRGIALSDAERANMKSVRDKYAPQVQALRHAEQTDVRGALTPANQATFDANLKRVQNRQAKRTIRGRQLSKP